MSACTMNAPEPDRDNESETEAGTQPVMLDAAALRTAGLQLSQKPLDIDGLGRVFVRELTTAEAGRIDAMFIAKQAAKVRTHLVCWCTVDATGTRLFEDKDIKEIGEWASDITRPISDLALAMSGYESDIAETQGN